MLKGTYGTRHGTNHDDRSTFGHELRSFKRTEPSSHNIDIEQLSDLLGGVVVGDIVLDNTRGGDEGLEISVNLSTQQGDLRQSAQTSP